MILSVSSLNKLPDSFGIYEFRNEKGTVIYIGKAINLKKRVSSYFRGEIDSPKIQHIRSEACSIEVIEVESEFEALLLEARLINLAKPRLNIIWKDDKSYVYIKLTKDEFPRFLLSRKNEDAKKLFGPYPSAKITSEMLSYLRQIFPFCTQPPSYKKICFYNHLGLCNPCPAEIKKADENEGQHLTAVYMANIKNIEKILTGKSKTLLRDLDRQMKTKAAADDFEKAAKLRDKIKNLNDLITVNRFRPEAYIENPLKSDQKTAVEAQNLKNALLPFLKIKGNISHIECYDISNLSGKFATGSMVTFRNGRPDKSFYRRFRIRSLNTPNDFAMLKEVFSRRFKRKEWPLPDLIIVDGGQLQLEILLIALADFNLDVPAVGLAKKFEEIYVNNGSSFEIIRLQFDNPALNLIRRIRDEAHRFAITYHRKLRMKNMLDLLQK